jgi:8-oxo-dGTP pyrophosphatase MutT (NUDIX family)
MVYSKEDIRRALQLKDIDAAIAHQKMVPQPRGVRPPESSGQPRQGAVLLLLYIRENRTHLVLTRRRDDLNSHAGQISFPGGRREEGESLRETAEREANEELNIQPEALEHLGRLECLYIPPSDYEVYPFVAWHLGQPDFIPQPEEVAEIIEVPLGHLIGPATYQEETWEIRGYQVQVPHFRIDHHKVWGATAMMLSDFLERLRNLPQTDA